MRDIKYFSESRMNTGYDLFYQGLPTHLKQLTPAPGLGVLQGYRGPPNLRNNSCGDSDTLYSSCGVQEVRFQFKSSKHMNWNPVIGQIAFGVSRAIEAISGSSDWRSVYFDESSGEMKSSSEAEQIKSKNGKAEANYKEGVKFEACTDDSEKQLYNKQLSETKK